jgi:hypothetical protein
MQEGWGLAANSSAWKKNVGSSEGLVSVQYRDGSRDHHHPYGLPIVKREKKMNNYKPFSLYRHKDYVVPRSLKEAYGQDVELYVEPERRTDLLPIALVLTLIALTIVLL